jgi:hypothetical protein
MSEEQPWIPCPLCRSGNYAVQRSHWLAFECLENLEAHVKQHLPMKRIEGGALNAIVEDWRLHKRFAAMAAEACRDPMRSVMREFEEQFGKRRT